MKDYFFDNPFFIYPRKGYDYVSESQRDLAYMSRLYPDMIKQLQRETDNVLDHYDYYLSPIYDEYPDREVLLYMISQIYGNVKNKGLYIPEEVLPQNDNNPDNSCVYYLVMLTFTHELLNRRRHHRASAF